MPATGTPSDDLRTYRTLFRWFVLTLLVTTVAAYGVMPWLAVRWSRRPFPGFVVEKTLVVSDYHGAGWGPTLSGLRHPERIAHLGDQPVTTLQDFERAVEALVPSEAIEVRTIMPDGATQAHVVRPLARFPQRELLRLFWIPYGVGVVYLAIGVWIYALQGHTPPGRAFALFCAFTALVNGLFFDLISTHLASAIWTTALALEGGARVC